jgi:hypothetical protein
VRRGHLARQNDDEDNDEADGLLDDENHNPDAAAGGAGPHGAWGQTGERELQDTERQAPVAQVPEQHAKHHQEHVGHEPSGARER